MLIERLVGTHVFFCFENDVKRRLSSVSRQTGFLSLTHLLALMSRVILNNLAVNS